MASSIIVSNPAILSGEPVSVEREFLSSRWQTIWSMGGRCLSFLKISPV